MAGKGNEGVSGMATAVVAVFNDDNAAKEATTAKEIAVVLPQAVIEIADAVMGRTHVGPIAAAVAMRSEASAHGHVLVNANTKVVDVVAGRKTVEEIAQVAAMRPSLEVLVKGTAIFAAANITTHAG